MRYITDRVAKAPVPYIACQYCGGEKGQDEIIHTGDENSLDGWEYWFCCHSCLKNGWPCETFILIPIDPLFGNKENVL